MAKQAGSNAGAVGWTSQVAAMPNLGVPVVLLLMVSTVMMAVLTFAGANSPDKSAETSARALAQSLLLEARNDLATSVAEIARGDTVAERLGAPDELAAFLGSQLREPLGLASGWIVYDDGRTLLGFIGDAMSTADPFQLMPSGLREMVAAARIDGTGVPDTGAPVLIFTRTLDKPFPTRLETL